MKHAVAIITIAISTGCRIIISGAAIIISITIITMSHAFNTHTIFYHTI